MRAAAFIKVCDKDVGGGVHHSWTFPLKHMSAKSDILLLRFSPISKKILSDLIQYIPLISISDWARY
jgi:hypothetical protein